MLKYIFLLIPLFGLSQKEIPKKTNTIEIVGISFNEVATGLLDAGYSFDKIDSNFKTIKTDFKEGIGKNKWLKLRFMIRVKDSTTTIAGEWYSRTVIGTTVSGVEQTIDNSTHKIEYRSGASKNPFLEMNTFAISFKKDIRYLTK